MRRSVRKATSVFVVMTMLMSFAAGMTVLAEDQEIDREDGQITVDTEETTEVSEPEEQTDPEPSPSEEASDEVEANEPEDADDQDDSIVTDQSELPKYNAPAQDPNSIVFKVSYKMKDDSDWTIHDYMQSFDMIALFPAAGAPAYHIKAEFDNGTVEEVDYDQVNYEFGRRFTKGNYEGISSVTYTITNFDGSISINKPLYEEFSGVEVDGVFYPSYVYPNRGNESVVSDNSPTGKEYEVTFYHPDTYSGKVSFDSYDGTITKGYTYEFRMDFVSITNCDMDNFYWTLDSDPSVKHSYDPSHRFSYIFQIPVGDSITLHNIPVYTSYSYYMPASTVTSSNGQLVRKDGQEMTYSDVLNDTTLSQSLLYKVQMGDGVAPGTKPRTMQSGILYRWGVGDNFELNVYLMRRQAQILFSKVYDANNNQYCDPDDLHHFKITLKDEETGKAYANQKVAYKIYDSINDKIAYQFDIATTNASGELELDVPAGKFVQLGRTAPNTYSADQEFYSGESAQYAEYYRVREDYFPELGILPCGINYTIEEISDKYADTTSGDYKNVVVQSGSTGRYDNWPVGYEDPSASYNVYDIRDYLNDDCGITAPVVTNVRDLGTLSVTKKVTGSDTDDAFTVNVTFTAADGLFPSDLPCIMPDGSAGTLSVTNEGPSYKVSFELKAGEKMEITDIPAGVDYEVEEDDASAGDADVSYKNASGVITSAGSEVKITNKYEEDEEDEDTDDKPKYVPATGEGTSVYSVIATVFIVTGTVFFVTGLKRRRLEA